MDADSVKRGAAPPPRFECVHSYEDLARSLFASLKDNPQVLAVELAKDGQVVDRFDRLLELLPDVTAAAVKASVLEPNLWVATT